MSAVPVAETVRPAAGLPGLDASLLALPNEPQGRFLVHERLGRGATATVYRGSDLATGRPVAIKVAEGPADKDSARIRHEARVLASLNHPAVVRFVAAGTVHDGDRWAGRPYLVEEYASGGSLSDRLHEGVSEPGAVAAWAADALAGLDHVHGRGLVHRDIKPANILLSQLRRSTVRLADFGIAVTAGTAPEPGMSSGTVHYMSPEQAREQPLHAATDVYALGLVLLECLTGEKAYPGTPVESLVARTLRSPEIPATLGSGWTNLLTAMTAMNPADRPSAAAARKKVLRMVPARPQPLLRVVG